ncbi:hypothetical protein BSPLISOX_864, partial [uncultured Gammaproteobacteria bacterium]
GTYYYWDAKTGPNIRGNILGVAIELTPSVSFEFGQENNNTMDTTSYGKLTVKLPLGNKQKFTNFAIANKAFKDSRKMDLGALAWVERSNKIVKEIIIAQNSRVPPSPAPPAPAPNNIPFNFKGLTYIPITSPDTGRIWLDRNLGASQVCDSSVDFKCFGYYYQWGRNDDGHEYKGGEGLPSVKLASSFIDAGTDVFIETEARKDWVKKGVDDRGELRTAAWKNGGDNDICPAGFSVPTEAELRADTIGATTMAIANNKNALDSFLKLPVAGYYWHQNYKIFDIGLTARLWSRSTWFDQGAKGLALIIDNSTADIFTEHIGDAASIRCINDISVNPDISKRGR